MKTAFLWLSAALFLFASMSGSVYAAERGNLMSVGKAREELVNKCAYDVGYAEEYAPYHASWKENNITPLSEEQLSEMLCTEDKTFLKMVAFGAPEESKELFEGSEFEDDKWWFVTYDRENAYVITDVEFITKDS